ncbi:MAG: response regulator [Planctomycetota bacterium]
MPDAPADILLVEDNPNDVELTLHALRKNGLAASVRVVRDGVEALEFLFGSEGAPPHDPPPGLKLILLDLKLPRLDGIEVLKRLKADPRTRSTPVVILTSSRQKRDLVECYQMGVNSFIVKPMDYKKFVEAVGQVGLYWMLVNQRSEP